MNQKFKKFEVISLQASKFKTDIQNSRSTEYKLSIARWDLVLHNSGIISDNYKLRTTEGEIHRSKDALPIPLEGITTDGYEARITINNDFVYGFIEEEGKVYNIEPLSYYDKQAAPSDFIMYESQDVIEQEAKTCGTDVNRHKHNNQEFQRPQIKSRAGACFAVDYAFASDFSMFQKYGSISGVENHNFGVLNDVQENYDDEFADEIKFVVVEQFIVNCSGCDPWTTSNDADVLLESFTNWAPGGFNPGHDVGTIWTDRNFTGSTIGIAWLGSVCTPLQYNALSDFSSNATFLRVMQAHELGHNFDAVSSSGTGHDPTNSPFIMAPAVQSTSTWSSASISLIESYYSSAGCLSNCAPSGILLADLEYNYISQCEPGVVEFIDLSTGNISDWLWEFPGGTPSSSTQQNPTVTYSNPGLYSVSLTVSNAASSSTKVLPNEIEIFALPTADFTSSINGATVSFFNLSSSGFNDYLWNFGDGNTSTDFEPIHTYQNDGSYTVTLTVTNDCGTSLATSIVTIATPPVANFTTTTNTTGCSPLTVQFDNTSSNNAFSYLWEFEGGSPATSTLENPSVLYNSAGTYNVTLTASNANGTNKVIKVDYVTVNASPVANFNYTGSGLVYTMNNLSTNAVSYNWNFGDGMTSTNISPTHSYANSGTYTVRLIASNNTCVPDTITQTINVTLGPVSLFTVSNNSGCLPFNAQFTNLSQNNPTSYAWTFDGGNPASSSEQNPSVNYNAVGQFDVTLITSNSLGSDTLFLPNYITVADLPNPSFTQSNVGLTFNFSNTSNGATSFVWNFGDGNTSLDENPTHTYGMEGNYQVSFTATNNCGSSTIPGLAQAVLAPVASYSYSNNNICPNDSIHFTNTSTGINQTLLWLFPGGSPSSSTANNPVVHYGVSGSYPVTIIVSNSAGIDTMTINNVVVVKPLPSSSFNYSISGLTITVINTSTNSNSILWTLPDGTFSNLDTVVYTVGSNGNYTFKLDVENTCGSNSITQVIGLNSLPVSGINSNVGTIQTCAPISVEYSATQNSGSSYLWKFDGGNPSESTDPNPIVAYQDSGSFNVTLITTNTVGADTLTLTNYINVNDGPESDYSYTTQDLTANFTYVGESGVAILWDFAGQDTSSNPNPSYLFSGPGEYTVTLYASNSCGTDTTAKVLVFATDIDEVNSRVVKVYPNPTNNIINIEFANDAKRSISLTDVLGRNIRNISFVSNEKFYSLNIQDLPIGMYYLMLKDIDINKVSYWKIVKE